MAIIIQDSFNRADSTTGLGVADTGQSWQALSGVWGIQNNQAYWVNGNPALHIVESGKSDVTVTLDNIVNVANDPSGTIAFRVSDASNYWLFRSLSGTLQLYKFVNGSASLVSSKTFNIYGNHAFKVIAVGALIECFIDDVLQISVTDAFNQNATKHGLRNHVATQTRFDNYLVQVDGPSDTGTETTESYDLKQAITAYNQSKHATKQSIYSVQSNAYDSKQAIFKQFQSAFDTLQEIYNTSVIRIENYAMKIVINKDVSAEFSTRQLLNKATTIHTDLKQVISRLDVLQADTRQILTKQIDERFDTLQRAYAGRQADYDTLIRLRDDILSLIGTINLKAKRELYINLKARQELYIHLKGGLNMTMENQNFSMYSGDTKYIQFPVDGVESLIGSSLKWGIRKNKFLADNVLVKTTDDGISIVNDEIQIKLEPEDTQELSGTYYQECELTDSLGNISTVLVGMFTINNSGI